MADTNKQAMAGADSNKNTAASNQRTGTGQGGNAQATGGDASFGSSSSDITNAVSVLSTAISSAAIAGGGNLTDDVQRVLDQQFALTQRYLFQTQQDFSFWLQYYAPIMRNFVEEFYGYGTANPGEQLYVEVPNNRRGPSAMKARRQTDLAWAAAYNNTDPDQVGKMRWDALDFADAAFVMSCGYDDFAIRFEIARGEGFDNRRWNHRVMLANIGVDAGNQATQGMAAAIGEMGAARQGLADGMVARGAGALRLFGAASELVKKGKKTEDE